MGYGPWKVSPIISHAIDRTTCFLLAGITVEWDKDCYGDDTSIVFGFASVGAMGG